MTEKERKKIKNTIKEFILDTKLKIQEYSKLSKPISPENAIGEFQEWMSK